jgi:hypothetical protein
VEQGSVFDQNYLAIPGTFDVVYSLASHRFGRRPPFEVPKPEEIFDFFRAMSLY